MVDDRKSNGSRAGGGQQEQDCGGCQYYEYEVREKEKRKVKTKLKERRVEKYGRKEGGEKKRRLGLKPAGVVGCGKGLPR